MLEFYNTLSKKREVFKPAEPPNVLMYTCGPTVYDFAHIGNFRAYVFEDILRRYLKFKGYNVTQVMNITDVDDKTIRNSQKEGLTLSRFTRQYENEFFKDLKALNIESVEFYPRATDHIDEMVTLIEDLMEKGLAYEGTDSSIYFKISSFKDYGKLSGLKIQELKEGARVAVDEYDKEEARDFALWKAYDPRDGDVFWETNIGKGRPGWHTECSAMAMKYLGETLDIHAGGVDLVFPHHENEIAQSEGATGKKFVNFWLHNEHLLVEGRKMSKSLGNFFTLRDILEKGYSPISVRYLLLASHYTKKQNFTFKALESAEKTVKRYNDFISRLKIHETSGKGGELSQLSEKFLSEFEKHMDNNLNSPQALASLFDFIRDSNKTLDEGFVSHEDLEAAVIAMEKIESVLGLEVKDSEEVVEESGSEEIEKQVEKREKAREEKDWATSDKIRDDLLEKGIIIEDTPDGVKWKRK